MIWQGLKFWPKATGLGGYDKTETSCVSVTSRDLI